MPPAATKSKYGKKLSKSYMFTPSNPKGHLMAMKCEELSDERTVQIVTL